MINELINLANKLDSKGFRKEADYLDAVIKRAQAAPSSPEGQISALWAEINNINDRASRLQRHLAAADKDIDTLRARMDGGGPAQNPRAPRQEPPTEDSETKG